MKVYIVMMIICANGNEFIDSVFSESIDALTRANKIEAGNVGTKKAYVKMKYVDLLKD